MDIKWNRKQANVAILALSSALTLCSGAAVAERPHHADLSETIPAAVAHQVILEGILFLGPIERISADGQQINVLGKEIPNQELGQLLLPSQYVAVYGNFGNDGSMQISRIEPLGSVYAPGSSLVAAVGILRPSNFGSGHASLGNSEVNAMAFSDFGYWSAQQFGKIAVVVGTQAIEGAPIDPVGLAAFEHSSELILEKTVTRGRGISGPSISVRGGGMDGVGISTFGKGIDGSGATIKGIDGSGATIKGIDGSGATIKGIDGSGASTNGSEGPGTSI